MNVAPTDIAIAVVEHAGRFLIGRRPTGAPLPGLWEFPGGKVEPGETPAEAAVRECREETGLEIEVVGEFPVHTETYEHGFVRLHFFQCRASEIPASLDARFHWAERAKLTEYEFPRGNDRLIALLTQP
jgi:mutator protein MutT